MTVKASHVIQYGFHTVRQNAMVAIRKNINI